MPWKLIHHRAAYEPYTLVYRPMGFEIHSSAPSLFNGVFEVGTDGRISFSTDRTAEQMVGARALSLTTFASTLVLAAPHLRLKIGPDADRIRAAYVPDEIPPEQRIGGRDTPHQ